MDMNILILNFAYAIGGSLITLVAMLAGYKLFDSITPFDTQAELAKGNQAVGTVVGAILIGLGIAVGLVVGLGLN